VSSVVIFLLALIDTFLVQTTNTSAVDPISCGFRSLL